MFVCLLYCLFIVYCYCCFQGEAEQAWDGVGGGPGGGERGEDAGDRGRDRRREDPPHRTGIQGQYHDENIKYKYRIRPTKRTVPNKRNPPIFRGNWGTSKRQRLSPYVKSPKEVTKTKSHTFPLAVSANPALNIPPFQQSLCALTVHIRRMIVLLTN